MFKKDLYMKVVFTIIALSSCVIAIRNTELIKKAEAYTDTVRVVILNTDDIGSSIAKKLLTDQLISPFSTGLRVEVTNASSFR